MTRVTDPLRSAFSPELGVSAVEWLWSFLGFFWLWGLSHESSSESSKRRSKERGTGENVTLMVSADIGKNVLDKGRSSIIMLDLLQF